MLIAVACAPALRTRHRPISDIRGFELTAPKRPLVYVPRPPKVAPQVWAHTGGQHSVRLKRAARSLRPCGLTTSWARRSRCGSLSSLFSTSSTRYCDRMRATGSEPLCRCETGTRPVSALIGSSSFTSGRQLCGCGLIEAKTATCQSRIKPWYVGNFRQDDAPELPLCGNRRALHRHIFARLTGVGHQLQRTTAASDGLAWGAAPDLGYTA